MVQYQHMTGKTVCIHRLLEDGDGLDSGERGRLVYETWKVLLSPVWYKYLVLTDTGLWKGYMPQTGLYNLYEFTDYVILARARAPFHTSRFAHMYNYRFANNNKFIDNCW